MYFMYKISQISSGKIYIGQTVRPNRRWKDHQWHAKNKQEQYIHRAMAKYGIDDFIFEVVATCRTKEDANEIEDELIIQYNSRDFGYNVARGGALAAWNAGLAKELQPMYGKLHSQQTREKISKSNMGKIMPPHTEEWKENQSKNFTGHIVTLKTREKISKSNKKIHAGEKSGMSKLSNTQANEIRNEYENTNITQKELAIKYNVSQTAIWAIVRDKSYLF